MDEPYTDNPGVVNAFSNGASEPAIVGRAPAADGFRGGTIPMSPFVHALDAAMNGDVSRLRAIVSTLTQRDKDHLAKSADRLMMMCEDDLL